MELLESLLYMLGEMSPYILLGFLIAGILYAFIPRSTMARHLSGTGFKSVVKSALIGIPLPLCSCGVLPTAIGMRRSGASRAATTSFLVATPQTGVDSIAATWSLLGPAFAVIRPIAALVTAIGGGVAVGRGENATAASCGTDACATAAPEEDMPRGFIARCKAALRYGFVDLVGSIGGWLVAGLLIAAVITVYVPADFFSSLGDAPLLSMIAVVVIAIPMYVCATGSIPIAMSLMLKGLSPGTALVLLMAGPAANFASFTLISREMGRRAALTYLAAIIIGAIGFGLIIDYLLPRQWFALGNLSGACHSAAHMGWFTIACSVLLAGLLIYSFIRRKSHKHHHMSASSEISVYTVKGMNCPHCQAAVTKAISAVPGVEHVEVNLSTGAATVEGHHSPEALKEAVRLSGFDVVD